MVREGRARPRSCTVAYKGGTIATTWENCIGFGCVQLIGATWLAQNCPGHSPSEERPSSAGDLEKKLQEDLDAILISTDVRGRSVRIMFQDEARFGRMVRIRRCWSPAPLRPLVNNGYERQFVYVYGAVSPLQGELDWMISSLMNTEQMGQFLDQVSQAHPKEFIVMVLDGDSSHKSHELQIPENIRLHRLPSYSPELNPQEHVWDELREKEFPNRVFDSMDGVLSQLRSGLPRLAANTQGLRSLTAWPWIVSLNLNRN